MERVKASMDATWQDWVFINPLARGETSYTQDPQVRRHSAGA
jgi:hypothetical protein